MWHSGHGSEMSIGGAYSFWLIIDPSGLPCQQDISEWVGRATILKLCQYQADS